MVYRAVVFDLDGTLVDSLADLAASGNELLSSLGQTTHPADAYRYFVGNGSRKLVERLLPDAGPEETERALATYKEIYARRLLEHTRPYDGIPELLAALRARGVKLAVCTNKHQTAAEAVLGKLFAAGTFDAFTGDRPSVPPKPDPANALYVMERLGIRPEETAYLGDTAVDMETAVRSGALPVGVLWGFRPREELTASGARVLLEKPLELLEKVIFPHPPR
ncbi:MAG: HAD family hydrolase [Schwartzia sp.]|nr:HAD family hydrolase [Schwartzia sp. (in: firmicutes)]